MKKFFKEFKDFISRGNVLQLAIGVVVGGAFGKITTSLVNDIITPLIASLIGASGFSDLKWVIKPADTVAGTTEIALRYGAFIQTILDFLIIAFCIFLMMKLIMKISDGFKHLSTEIKENIENLSKKEVRQIKKIVKKYAKLQTKVEKDKNLTQEEKLTKIEQLNEEKEKELEQFKPKQEVALESAPEQPKPEPEPSSTDKLLIEIRDLLKENAEKEAKEQEKTSNG